MKRTRNIFLLAVLFLIVSCGGSGGGSSDGASDTNGGNDGDGTPSESAGSSLSSDNAQVAAAAISTAAVGVSQAVNGSSAAAMTTKNALKTLKDTGSFSGTAVGSGGGNCELTGSGASELNSDPMTFSVSGSMVCTSYATTVSTASGSVDVQLDGTITSSMSGSISQDYSSVELSYTLNWSDLVLAINGESYNTVAGNYSLSIAGEGNVFTLIESGTVGEQTVSRTYSYTYSPTYEMVSVYDNFYDNFYIYVDTRNYLGSYVEVDPDLNTCPVNATAYINAMSSSSLHFNARGAAESASGGLSSVADMYFYTGHADTFYCTFGVSTTNLTNSTHDFLTMICYDNDNVRLCDAGWSKLSRYDATAAPIKDNAIIDKEEAVDALNQALDTLEECNDAI